jgi:hypothetical protein
MADDRENLTKVGAEVIRSDEVKPQHHCRPGTWLIVGGALATALAFAGFSPSLMLGATFLSGFAANEWERRRIIARLAGRKWPRSADWALDQRDVNEEFDDRETNP